MTISCINDTSVYILLSFSSLDLLILKLKALCGTLTMQSMNVIISFIGEGHSV